MDLAFYNIRNAKVNGDTKEDLVKKTDIPKHLYPFFILVLIILPVLFTGCDRMRSTIKIGYSEISSPSGKSLEYQTFTGSTGAGVNLEQGETLVLNYDAQVTKGTLTLEVQNPDQDIVWDTRLQETVNNSVELQAQQSGNYLIMIEGDDTGGGLELSWSVES